MNFLVPEGIGLALLSEDLGLAINPEITAFVTLLLLYVDVEEARLAK